MTARTSPPRLGPLASTVALVFPFALAGQDSRPGLALPAFTAYAHPDPEALSRRDDGTVATCEGRLVFYVGFASAGEVRLRLDRGPAAAASLRTSLVAQVEPVSSARSSVTALSAAKSPEVVDLGTFTITTPGPHRIVLENTDKSPLREVRRLLVEGPAARDAKANTLERRNAASVHLGYPVPKADEDAIEWFYCEVTPRTDPLWTYYMATGWHRGYFGMQVNSEAERRVIFSVWDSGHEGIDRAKVAEADRVQLVAKGDGVVAEGFGHEGTGGHSHLVHPWKLGATFRFLVHAKVDGEHTTYTGWFWFAETARWGLVGSFRAPKDGQHLRGLYSFNENFSGSNGDLQRDCEFGNPWVRTTSGTWLPLRTATFTHDGTGKTRLDRCAGTRGSAFYLQNGGFVTPPPDAVTRYGARLEAKGEPGRPPTDAELPATPTRTK